MDYFVNQTLQWIEAHFGIICMGLIGATVAYLLSNETRRDKVIGFIVGLCLCVALSDVSSQIFARGSHPEIFGFLWGAIGKSTAEILLSKLRTKATTAIENKVDSQ